MIWPCFISRLQPLPFCNPCSRFTGLLSVPPTCHTHLPRGSVHSFLLPRNDSHHSSSRVNQPSDLNLNTTFSERTSLTLLALSVTYSFTTCGTFPITRSMAVFHRRRNNTVLLTARSLQFYLLIFWFLYRSCKSFTFYLLNGSVYD